MALKKINAAVEKKTEKKSSMKIEVITDKKLGEIIKKAFVTKQEIKELEAQVKKLDTVLKPLADTCKADAIDRMIDYCSFDSLQLSYEDAQVGIICMDKYNGIKEPDSVVDHLTEIVGEKNVDKFVEYETLVNGDALENKKVLEAVEKLATEIKSKYDVDLLTQVLKVKKGAIDEVNSVKSAKDKKALVDILKPVITMR